MRRGRSHRMRVWASRDGAFRRGSRGRSRFEGQRRWSDLGKKKSHAGVIRKEDGAEPSRRQEARMGCAHAKRAVFADEYAANCSEAFLQLVRKSRIPANHRRGLRMEPLVQRLNAFDASLPTFVQEQHSHSLLFGFDHEHAHEPSHGILDDPRIDGALVRRPGAVSEFFRFVLSALTQASPSISAPQPREDRRERRGMRHGPTRRPRKFRNEIVSPRRLARRDAAALPGPTPALDRSTGPSTVIWARSSGGAGPCMRARGSHRRANGQRGGCQQQWPALPLLRDWHPPSRRHLISHRRNSGLYGPSSGPSS